LAAKLAQPICVIKLSEQQIIDQLAQRLAGVYTDVESDHVARVVNEEYSRFDGRPIRDYIPLFVERHCADRLSRLVGA
jgi:hypothetical protein